ncbi:unnamed protein product [Gongylonema pulchrum]|uniref:Protein KTI12 homolog n=1 Tax=Gongylonema pulchrum TaxID=637853 RepID=A0A183DUW8_9BILA|nr:unnamed protein product [Gongylonema pulchrum]
MPLLVVCGGPSSGKSTVIDRICGHFRSQGIEHIEIVADCTSSGAFSREIYSDSHKVRVQRVSKSEVRRLISKDRLVICDSLNYIKGFRYELFCIAKEAQTTYAVLYCDANEDTCQWLNMQKDETERWIFFSP